jgi:hypothetical protein
MGRVHNSTNTVNPLIIGGKQPLDVRTVLENVADLKNRTILTSVYKGMVVYVVEDSSLYVCNTDARTLTNVEDGWSKVNVDYSVRIVETVLNITDGKTILFPYQGMMVYVTSEESLYILLTKGVENAKDIKNWKKISNSSSTLKDKVGINVAPEGGSGFKIAGKDGVIIDDYVNVENYIKAKYTYTSKGVNSFETNPNFTYESIKLSKGGDAYIELYANGDNWLMINDPENTLGLSVTIDGVDYVSGTPVLKGKQVCFGADIKFSEGWTITYSDITREFVESDYELIDIYRSENSPEVYAYRKDIDVRILTEDDLVNIDDKIDNLAHNIMIDLDGDSSDMGGSDSDVSEQVPLQNVIVNMNNAITKLEQTVIEPDSIEHSDIDNLFS